MSIASSVFVIAHRRTAGSLAVNAPSLNTGFEKRLVVAIGTFMPVLSSARRNRFRICSRSAGGRAGRHEIVVVEAHAVRAELGEVVHGVDRIERRARLVAEGVTTPVADGPEPEGEVVVGLRLVRVGHARHVRPASACDGKISACTVSQS